MLYTSKNHQSCTLLLLVGLKGSGKTWIGSVLEKHLAIQFLKIEPLFLELLCKKPVSTGIDLEKKGFQIVLDRLNELAQNHKILCIESTGTAHTFPELLKTLQQSYHLIIVRIKAPLETCKERVLARDSSVHIPVSDTRLAEINQRALQVDLPWDLEIDNSEFQAENTIINAFQDLLPRNLNDTLC
ncbi:MAG: hypothetical protein LRZ84_26010 [Desertifilum sp.]|nr:hypothetical protein [Desertifilum sp.]